MSKLSKKEATKDRHYFVMWTNVEDRTYYTDIKLLSKHEVNNLLDDGYRVYEISIGKEVTR